MCKGKALPKLRIVNKILNYTYYIRAKLLALFLMTKEEYMQK